MAGGGIPLIPAFVPPTAGGAPAMNFSEDFPDTRGPNPSTVSEDESSAVVADRSGSEEMDTPAPVQEPDATQTYIDTVKKDLKEAYKKYQRWFITEYKYDPETGTGDPKALEAFINSPANKWNDDAHGY